MLTAMRGDFNYGVLADVEGHHYQLSIDDSDQWWVLKLFDGPCPVGYANCLTQGNGLFLADLCISDDVPPTGRLACWARMFGLRLRHKNYRGRGLGSALLRVIIEHARRNGIEHIAGDLFPTDLAKNPELPTWYRQRGFQVTVAPDKKSGHIQLQLKASAITGSCPADEPVRPVHSPSVEVEDRPKMLTGTRLINVGSRSRHIRFS